MEEKKLAQAKATFATLCRVLDRENWKYDKDEEKLVVRSGAKGCDLPIELIIQVEADRSVVLVISALPFTVPEDKRLDVAIAITVVNQYLVNGAFDFDLNSGRLLFRLTNSIIGCALGEAALLYMILTVCKTVDTYNDQFFMLSKNVMTLEQFLDKQKEESR